MNTKVGTALALLILITIGLYFYQNQNAPTQITRTQKIVDKKEPTENPQPQVKEELVEEKEVRDETIVEIPKIAKVEKEVPKEIVIPNGFKAVTSEDILEISSKELTLENYTEIFDKSSLNVYIDNYLNKNVKKKNIDNMLGKIKKYIKNSTVIIKKDKEYNVYLEIMEYKNEELMRLDDRYVKSKRVYHFGFDETEIKKEEDVNLFLSDLDIAIKEGEAKNLVLVGYTDSVGNRGYNTFLAYQRTRSFGSKLSKYDVGLKYIVRGASNPVASNETEEGRALNRRIEIFLGF